MNNEIFVDEFLYRGRASDDAQQPAWHVVLASKIDDGLGGTTLAKRMFSMSEAAAAGYPLPSIVQMINSDALRAYEALRDEKASADAEIASLSRKLSDADARIADMAGEKAS